MMELYEPSEMDPDRVEALSSTAAAWTRLWPSDQLV